MKNAIEFKGVSKNFGEVHANSDVTFSVQPGTIHAIVGENGAGKSTAMNMLFGMYQPNHGDIFIHGQKAEFRSPLDAMSFKIGMVHQHFMLAEPFTALDNILLHQNGSAFSLLPRKEQKQKLQEIAARYGFHFDLKAKVENLSVGEQQQLEILKILSQDSQILILDEPTAVLTPKEVQDLFVNLRTLKNEGKTILIITHKLKEVMSISDNVTVFRSGKVIASKKTCDTNTEDLAEMMVGRRIQKPQERKTSIDFSKPVLNFSEVSAQLGDYGIHNVNLTVHAKEIVGIAGVEGNGQDVLIRTLLDPHSLKKHSLKGTVKVEGVLSSFPEDRLRFGVMASRPVFENFILGQQRQPHFSRGIFLKIKDIIRITKETMNAYDVRPYDPLLPFENLSGGNQQKVVVARALSQAPQVLLAARPTRGVDIGAIEFIHNEMSSARDNGAGILLISSELDELMSLSDRILVIYKGRFIAEFLRSQFDEIAIGTAMGGGR
ncbi:MAG: ABC transporter ATP-binding protein [Pseudobdellovibrionaceae bacterium]